jgi:phosphate transport system substrate-binding protein
MKLQVAFRISRVWEGSFHEMCVDKIEKKRCSAEMRTIMRKRKLFAIAMSVMCTAALMTGCGSSNGASSSDAGSGADTGSASQPISVVSREDGSGTRGAFVELTGVEEKDADGNKTDNTTADAIISNSTEIMMTTVSGDEYAIGYSSTGSLNDTVKALNVDGVEPTAQNIKDGKYSLSRPFNIATKGTPGKLAQDFIDYILSEEGQKVVEDNGYIASVDDAKAFKSSGESGKLVVAGSSSVTPVMEKLAEAYKAVNKKAEIEIQESDSTTGMTAAADGTCDIGMASRELEDSEKDKGLTSQAIALDGIAVIVNTQNTRTEITTDMVKKIFTGEVTDWNDVTE